jgi:hypothetical protein
MNTVPAILAITIIGASALTLAGCAGERTLTFDPPYPSVDSHGEPIRAVFEGRIPCAAPCEKLKVQLVVYETRHAKTPSTYWLGVIDTLRDERLVSRGRYTLRQGLEGYPQAVVYELDTNAFAGLRYFWQVNEDILLVLDDRLRPKPGDAAWGYMLSRYDAPYGPRTYSLR